MPSSPERLRVGPAEAGSFVAAWLPPSSDQGLILRYTLYYEYGEKVGIFALFKPDIKT